MRLITSIFLFIINVPLYGGDMDSAGGFLESVKDKSAWFVDSKRTIEACLEWSSDFGAHPSEIKAQAEDSFKTWTSYLSKKKSKNRGPAPQARALNVELTCQGNEDLVFYLGVENDLIKKEMKKYNRPFALSIKTDFNPKNRWGKGIIWLVSDKKYSMQSGWSISNRLYSVLLHEWGHVFGVPHIEGTIMDPIFGHGIYSDGYFRKKHRIDKEKELIVANEVDSIYIEQEDVKNCAHCKREELFQKLMGRKGIGEISFKTIVHWHAQNQVKHIKIKVTDQKEAKIFNFVNDRELDLTDPHSYDLFNLNFFIFRAYWEKKPELVWIEDSYNRYHLSTIQFGSILDSYNRRQSVVFRHNAGGYPGPVKIDFFIDSTHYSISGNI